MKGYGLPRMIDLIQPDKIAVSEFGLQSSVLRLPKYGNIKNSFRKSKAKRETRRIWKKKARAAHSQDLRQQEREAVE